MASYHLSAQVVKRSEGRSVVAMAAYRAGVKLRDEHRGVDADYRRRRGVAHAEIMAPEGCAEWLFDRERLWNGVEKSEVRRDAQLAREINMALPHELSDAQRLALVRKFISEQFVRLGMVADVAIHMPVVEKGDDPRNFHAHVLLTLRQAGGGGLRRVKTREWNSDTMLAAWRAAWADYQNDALREHGHVARVDHRSLSVQRQNAVARRDVGAAIGLSRLPELHVGPKAKKAGNTAVPQSRDRAAGPARRRTISYTKIDRGSRGAVNIARLLANARGFEGLAEKTEKQLIRMRGHQARYKRQVRLHTVMLERDDYRQNDGDGSHAETRSKVVHALERSRQAEWWIAELDRFFFMLLGIRESQLVRRTVWSNRMGRWRSLEPASPRGGGRARDR